MQVRGRTWNLSPDLSPRLDQKDAQERLDGMMQNLVRFLMAVSGRSIAGLVLIPGEVETEDRAARYVDMLNSCILHHFTEDISLTECADRLGIGPHYLSHTFKAWTGKPFWDI